MQVDGTVFLLLLCYFKVFYQLNISNIMAVWYSAEQR